MNATEMDEYEAYYLRDTAPSTDHFTEFQALRNSPATGTERMYDDTAALLVMQHDATCHNLTVYGVVGEFVNFRLSLLGMGPVRDNGV
jgi:hypothetical protein